MRATVYHAKLLRRAMNMARSLLSLTGVILLALGAGEAMADDVRFLDEDGITYSRDDTNDPAAGRTHDDATA